MPKFKEVPTNVEILHKEGLEGKLITDISGSHYKLLITKKDENQYNAVAYDPFSTKRKVIGKNISMADACLIINHALTPKERKNNKFNTIVNELIGLTNNIRLENSFIEIFKPEQPQV